jgi:hypothetical protein
MELFRVTTNTIIVNYCGNSVFICEKIQSNDYIFYRSIECEENKHCVTFTEKEIIKIEKI